jgi:hypothetical protein
MSKWVSVSEGNVIARHPPARPHHFLNARYKSYCSLTRNIFFAEGGGNTALHENARHGRAHVQKGRHLLCTQRHGQRLAVGDGSPHRRAGDDLQRTGGRSG